jgi:drug efflux transport system permease protein
MGMQILSLIIKEFIAILGDKRSRMVIMVPPVLQVLVFGYAATYDLNNIPYAVLNEDGGHASRSLIARFDGSPSFERIATLDSTEEVDELIDTRKALLVIHIGQNFSDDLSAGRSPVVQLIIDGRNSNTALIAANDAQSIVGSFAYELLGSVNRRGPDAVLVDRVWYNPNLLSRWFIVPGIVGLLTMVVTTMVTSLSIARERELGTLDQLLVTPMRSWEIVLGKAIPPFIIGVAEAGFIVLVAIYWFHVPFRGNLGTLFIGIACFLLSAIGVGLAISSIARTMQQGLLGAFIFLVPSVILSGFATPIANMPHLVQQLTLINPLRYYMVVLRGVFLEGATLSSLSSQLWPMLVIGVFNLAVAQWLFRHRSS